MWIYQFRAPAHLRAYHRTVNLTVGTKCLLIIFMADFYYKDTNNFFHFKIVTTLDLVQIFILLLF